MAKNIAKKKAKARAKVASETDPKIKARAKAKKAKAKTKTRAKVTTKPKPRTTARAKVKAKARQKTKARAKAPSKAKARTKTRAKVTIRPKKNHSIERGKRRAPATLRSTSGAGFEFEDLVSGWLMAKMLLGEEVPGIGGIGEKIQAQVSTLGWRMDDLLVTTMPDQRRLAISAKGNLQVSAAGFPSDFVTRAWEQWRDPQSPFDRSRDALALITLGSLPAFDEPWREVQAACSGSDMALAMSRIRNNPRQLKVFQSVQTPGLAGTTEDETIRLIRCLHVLPTDFQSTHSETTDQIIAQCRKLLADGSAIEAGELWKTLKEIAGEVRLRRGTITLPELIVGLRTKFDLRQHPDYERDRETLNAVTADYKKRIKTELSSGHRVSRAAEIKSLKDAISSNALTIVLGDSGSGKSALVKTVLDNEFPIQAQVWLGPDELKIALSAARRSMLPLLHDLGQVLNATVKPRNVLVIDAGERVEPAEMTGIRDLVQEIRPAKAEAAPDWSIVVVTQPQDLLDWSSTLQPGQTSASIVLEPLTKKAVRDAIQTVSGLEWLVAHEDTIAALSNLRTLAWVVDAAAALSANPAGLASHTAIADRLWTYWTGGRSDIQSLAMRLGEREASFERSFPLTSLAPSDAQTFNERSSALPLRINRTNNIEFEHDLAADWARYQYLKQIAGNTARWSTLAANPLWMNALRMLGQFLLRESAGLETAWDVAFRSAELEKLTSASDILLDALCLDPEAERFLNERIDLLMTNGAHYLTRLLIRFLHIGTVPAGGQSADTSELALYIEARYRSIVIGRWPPLLRFIVGQRKRLESLVSPPLAKVLQTWLTRTPRTSSNGVPVPFRREAAEIALNMARTVQVEKSHGIIYLMNEASIYTAPLAGAADLPDEVARWALELAGRRDISMDVLARITIARREQAKIHLKRLETDPIYKLKNKRSRIAPPTLTSRREKLPPWPLGASRQVDHDLRKVCFSENALSTLMTARPQEAAEVLLAIMIENEPSYRDRSSHFEVPLGLEYSHEAYPTAFWKSPFFSFLQVNPNVALGAVIALVNFCTDRWAEAVTTPGEEPLGLIFRLPDGTTIKYVGRYGVFDWTQRNTLGNGNLSCALDAVERWLTMQIDGGIDIEPYITRLLSECKSMAVIGLLVNIGKYKPILFGGPLQALFSDPTLFIWDTHRTKNSRLNFDAWRLPVAKVIWEMAKAWVIAPHRQRNLLDVATELLKSDETVAQRLKGVLQHWTAPEDPKEALEFKLICAALDRDNYSVATNTGTGESFLQLVYPESLREQVSAWDQQNTRPRQYLIIPHQVEEILNKQRKLTEQSAVTLYSLLRDDTDASEEDEGIREVFRLAVAAALIVAADSWLAKDSEAEALALGIVRQAIDRVPEDAKAIRRNRIGWSQDELKFVAFAAMHLWMKGSEDKREWEASVLRLLTTGNSHITSWIINIAAAHREKLGASWWRLVQIGVLWAGLSLLSPHGDEDSIERLWNRWLAKLRLLEVSGVGATSEDLHIVDVAEGTERLRFDRRRRAWLKEDERWRRESVDRAPIQLDDDVVSAVFEWLLSGRGSEDWAEDAKLARWIWEFDVKRASTTPPEKEGEYDLPSQPGYEVLLKLSRLSLEAPAREARTVWEPVLSHGPAAHVAIQYFVRGLFNGLRGGNGAANFEALWREIAEYGLAADWDKGRFWYHGEHMLCDLLGFGSEDALQQQLPGGAQRMRDIYERWANYHLSDDERNVTRFCSFLETDFGEALRLDGVRWIATVLKGVEKSPDWHRDETGEALLSLLTITVNRDAEGLRRDTQALQSLVEIAAGLVAKNVPAGLALQERIRRLRG